MLADVAEWFGRREEKLKLGKWNIVVREIEEDADTVIADPEDIQWKIFVRCVYREDNGQLMFGDKDIPMLKKRKVRMSRVVAAVNRVIGVDTEEEAKNSEAAQG